MSGHRKIKIEFELTKEQAMVLFYVIPDGDWGDPLKDFYECEQQFDHAVEDPYKALKQVNKTVMSKLGNAIDSLPSNKRSRD